MSTESVMLTYRAADAPLSGVVIAPATERTSERTPHPPFSPNSDKRRKKAPPESTHNDSSVIPPRDDGHLVDDYA